MKIVGKRYILFYFIGLLIVGLYLIPSPLVTDKITPTLNFYSTNADIIAQFGAGDPASYAKGGLAISQYGWFDNNTIWLINLWPPFFMLLQGVVLKVFGTNAPLVGILQILAAFMLAITFNLFRAYLCYFVRPLVAACIPLLLLISPQVRSFMLGSNYVIYGETFATSFVLIGTLCLLLASKENNKKMAIIAGTCFALSAYFRSQFEMFFMIATINILFIALSLKTYEFIQSQFNLRTQSNIYSKNYSVITLILVSLIAFHALTIPYKIYNHHRTNSFLWVQTSNYMFENNFIPSAELDKNGAAFLKEGGANTACLVDPMKCLEIRKDFKDGKIPREALKFYAIKTFLAHPLTWISIKARLLPIFWFNIISPGISTNQTIKTSVQSDNLFNYTFIGCFILSIIFIIATIATPESVAIYWLGSSIFFSYIIIFIVAQYESRYFNFFKLYFFMISILYVTKYISTKFRAGKTH